MKKFSLVLALAVTVLFAQAALATPMVTNGGFETGDFTGWTTSAPSNYFGVASGIGHLSNNAAWFGAVSYATMDIISQDLSTNPGESYTVNFYLANNFKASPVGTFYAYFGNTQIAAVTSSDAFEYTLYTSTVTALSSTTALTFKAYQLDGFFYLDDVSAASAVPIPGSLLLLASGLLPLGWRRLRKG